MVHQGGRAAIFAGAATLFICFAPPAYARFGKASSGSRGGSSHGASPSGGSSHSASPGGHPTTGGTYVAPGYRTRCSYYWGCRGGSALWYGYYSYYPFFGYGPPYFYYPYGSYVGLPPTEPALDRPAFAASLGLEAQARPSGSASSLGLDLRLEGQRLGLSTELQSILLRSDDGIGNDHIRLLNAYLTYALLVSPHGRLRLEAGVTSAFAPDLIVAGPSAGLSAIASIWGPLAVEGSAHITPFPYTQFDWQAGLAIGLGPVGVRAGWRRIFLNDQGLVDGISHKDIFSGPYVGLALML